MKYFLLLFTCSLFGQSFQFRPISIENYPGFECYRPMSNASERKMICYQTHDIDMNGRVTIPPHTTVYFKGIIYLSRFGGFDVSSYDRLEGSTFDGDSSGFPVKAVFIEPNNGEENANVGNINGTKGRPKFWSAYDHQSSHSEAKQ